MKKNTADKTLSEKQNIKSQKETNHKNAQEKTKTSEKNLQTSSDNLNVSRKIKAYILNWKFG